MDDGYYWVRTKDAWGQPKLAMAELSDGEWYFPGNDQAVPLGSHEAGALVRLIPDSGLTFFQDPLRKHCRDFIERHGITCPESVYQVDAVILNASEFIEGICGIIGYAASKDEAEGEGDGFDPVSDGWVGKDGKP